MSISKTSYAHLGLAVILSGFCLLSPPAVASTTPAIQIIVTDPEPTTDNDGNASTEGTVTVQAKIGKTVYTGSTAVTSGQTAQTKAANVAAALENAKDKDGNGLSLRISVNGNTVDVDNKNVSLAIKSSGVKERDTIKRGKYRARTVQLFASLVDPMFGREFSVGFETPNGIVTETALIDPGTSSDDVMATLAASFHSRADDFAGIGLTFLGLTDSGLLASPVDVLALDFTGVFASGGSFITGSNVAGVPLPATLGVFAMALGGLVLLPRRS